MDKKISFGQKVQELTNALANVMDHVSTVEKAYFDRGYNVGGSNEIIDADILPNIQLSAADLTNAITLLSQFKNFCFSQAVTQADYAATINKIRTDL